MNIEQLKELLDRIGNKVNLLHQAKLKRKVVQAFIDLLEDKQNMVIFFEEYSKKSIEIEKQNKRYHEIIKNLKLMVEDIDIDCGMICHEIRLIDLEGEE